MLRTALIVILIVVAAIFLAVLIVFERLTRRRPTSNGLSIARYYDEPRRGEYRTRLLAGQAWLRGRRGEPMSIRSDDGLTLRGTLYPADKPSDRCVIFFHGYRGSGFNDFSLYARWWLEHGFDALVVDQRAHNASDGTYLTLGVCERDDCLCWVRAYVERADADRHIVLFGVSMGAATVMAAADGGLPRQVEAIVADCGYSRPLDEIRCGLRFMKVPRFPVIQIGSLWCRLLGHFDPRSPGAIDALARTDVPVLFIHGDRDTFVPTSMSRDDFEACTSPTKRLLIVPGADHAGSYLTDPDLYETTLADFLAEAGL